MEISALSADRWFGSHLPAELLLGNPGTRDAFMHAIQCCVPNATLLPAAGRLDSHLGGARTLILPGRIGPATRESA